MKQEFVEIVCGLESYGPKCSSVIAASEVGLGNESYTLYLSKFH